jgi:hypothetical protein
MTERKAGAPADAVTLAPVATLTPAQFLVAFAIAAGAGTLVFFHADRHRIPHPGLGGVRLPLPDRRPAGLRRARAEAQAPVLSAAQLP